MASKSSDIRPKITLACVECKERNYITKKNRRNDPDRLEMKKFCPRCRTHTAHAKVILGRMSLLSLATVCLFFCSLAVPPGGRSRTGRCE